MQKKMFMTGVIFILPITVILGVFLFFPIFQSIYYSFTDWKGVGAYKFIGLDNYIDIFKSDDFTKALNRTLFIGVATACLANVFGLLLAILLDQKLKTKTLLRSLFYIPNIIPIVVAAFVWRYMLDANTGLINVTLSKIFGEKQTIPWIDSPDYVVYSLIFITVWQMMGPIIIVYLAALQGVPHEIKEAAMIDGSSRWRQFFSITLPMIAPGITVSVLIGLANGIRIFDLPFALTGGGPAYSSETLAIRIYRYAFQSTEFAHGMAASFVLTAVALIITIFFVSLSRKYEEGAHS